MGSLIGHIVPGTFFMTFAIWWTIEAFKRYFESRFSGRAFMASTFSTSCNNCQVIADPQAVEGLGAHQRRYSGPTSKFKIPPIEPTLKLIAVLLGMGGEYWTALDQNGHFVQIHNGQHMTMFGFFAFNAIFELLYFYRAPGLPQDLDYLSGAIAFGMEGLLFLWHLHGRSHLDTQVHTFLVYAIAMCTLSTVLEIFFKEDIRPRLLRAAFTLLQGTWFYCVGFILYPPEGWERWAPENHEQMMMVTMMFTWNVAGVMVFQFMLGYLVYRLTKRRFQGRDPKAKGHIDLNSNHGYSSVPQSDVTLNLLPEDEE